jgi:hypothetical protein
MKMNRSSTNVIKRILGIATSRRWVIGVLAALAGGLGARRDSAASVPIRQEAGNYKGRNISYGERDGALVVEIDGKPVDTIARLEPRGLELAGTPEAGATPVASLTESYSSDFFPFRTYASPDDIARALVDTEGQLWVLDQ